jgi:transposase-like protein
MNLGSSSRLPVLCFYKDCSSRKEEAGKEEESPRSGRIVRKGSFYRSSDSKKIARFQCLKCRRTFSQASFSECFGQKKRKINEPLRKLTVVGVSHRNAARVLGVSKNTVAKKLLFLEARAIQWQKDFLKDRASEASIDCVQFDEMESFEKSKCLPLSIPLMVEAGTAFILGHRVCSMPAKGHLAEISRRKYGYRADERTQSALALFEELKPFLSPTVEVSSDQNPKYPNWIKSQFPAATHLTYKGRRGCVVGQGELKAGGFDPIFSLNHTAAMLRAHVSRLFRRTWNTTKKKERLSAHIAIYIQNHNQRIISKL